MTRVFLSSRDNIIITSNNSRLGLVGFLPLSEFGQKSISMRIREESFTFLLIAEQKPYILLYICLLRISLKYTHKLSTAVYKLVCRRNHRMVSK